MQQLEGKIAVVTGASKGIGAEIARALAAAGAAVIVNYASSKAGADKVVAEIAAADGRAVAIQADVSKAADIERLFAETKQAFGGLDILVNNAGVYAFAPIEEVTEQEYRRQFDINVLGLLLATKEAVKLMGDKGGSIINVSSVVSVYAPPASSIYSATKGAVDVITKALSKELGPRGIRVNSVNPGMVETEGAHAQGIPESDFRRQMEAITPLGRIGQPGDIAPAVVFLASDEAGWITGETLFIGGGLK